MACEIIADWYEAAIERQGDALAAQNAALANLQMTSAYFVAAEVGAAACFLLIYTPPPFSLIAFGICEVTALAAMAAAAYSMDVYLDQFNEATDAYIAAEKLVAFLEEMLCKCEAQLALHIPTDETMQQAQAAFEEAEGVPIPDVDDSALDEAEAALDEAEAAMDEAEAYLDEHADEEEGAWPGI
ncbi:MAG: hypothetical protein A3I66_13470 [Burkholderiales bacterium RIFCSPLOWO2_02_FULL_57_36]|nr:MAG: hypothetical protein A3I66_13470 [Burkholderiales bacterium RIFCSPLOWO2_02_FULL_57_36]